MHRPRLCTAAISKQRAVQHILSILVLCPTCVFAAADLLDLIDLNVPRSVTRDLDIPICLCCSTHFPPEARRLLYLPLFSPCRHDHPLIQLLTDILGHFLSAASPVLCRVVVGRK